MLIVSCQADSDSPFNKPEYISLFAKCAESCGACAVRIEGIDNLKDVSSKVQIPIIGLVKDYYSDGAVRISRNEPDIKEILKYTDTVAIDGTFREEGPEFIKYIKNKYNCKIVADVSNAMEALKCADYSDYISTALSGYTGKETPEEPDYSLIRLIVHALPDKKLIAEGRFNTPEKAVKAKITGANYVCVGSAITNPCRIIKWYNEKLNEIPILDC
jgi:N-acylglucosamine-6-phosphate 2-epimerase